MKMVFQNFLYSDYKYSFKFFLKCTLLELETKPYKWPHSSYSWFGNCTKKNSKDTTLLLFYKDGFFKKKMIHAM